MVVPEGLRIKYFVLHDHTCSVSIEQSVNKDETGVRRSRESYKSKLSLIEGRVSVCVSVCSTLSIPRAEGPRRNGDLTRMKGAKCPEILVLYIK